MVWGVGSQMELGAAITYCVFEDESSGHWRVQCVSVEASSFENRRSLPADWRGVRDAELDRVVGDAVPAGCSFVHTTGFIGGHRTLEGALAMASRALEIE